MKVSSQRAAMLWTGGKDSALALHEAARDGCDIRCLVTFAPEQPDFLAHPLKFMMLQAQALELPHYVFPVGQPYEKSYEAGLRRLRDEMGIETVVTGDIAEVDGSPNWIRARSRPVDMNVHTPLWGRDRQGLLEDLLAGGFKVRFSCVKTRWLAADWIGRELDAAAVDELRNVRKRTGLDLCGEEGEYHTLVTDAPRFNREIRVGSFSRRSTDALAYMEIHRLEFISKTTAVSPCVHICRLDDGGVCLGCFRSRDEIARWSQLGAFAKSFINETANERRRLHLQKGCGP